MSGFDPAIERRPRGAAFIIAAILAAMGGLLVWQGFAIPDKGGYAGIGSGGMPKFVGFCLWGVALAHVWKGMRQPAPVIPIQEKAPLLYIIGGLALQLILLQPLGFSIASGILFAMTAAGFGKRNFVITLPIGVAFALMIYGIFDQLLKLNLPAGMLENLIFGG